MSNKLLKKVLDDIETLPSSEISKLIKEEIAESDMLEALMSSIHDGHLVFSSDRRLVYFNSSALHLLPSDRRKRMRIGMTLDSMLIDPDVKKFLMDVFTGKEKMEAKDFVFQCGDLTRTERVSFTSLHLENTTSYPLRNNRYKPLLSYY